LSRLLLVRHGITILHRDDRFWGSTDVALSDTGVSQAGKLRDRLAREKIKAIYTSILSRARVTAETIASKHKVKVTPCPELKECNFGYVEGLTFEEIQRLHPDLAEELLNWKTVAFPGGENIEQLNSRVLVFLEQLEKYGEKDTVLIVAHGGPLRLIICNLLGLGLEHWLQLRVELASLSIVETYSRGAILQLLNDTSHLK